MIEASEISMHGVTSELSPTIPSLNLRQNLEWMERQTVQQALQKAGGLKKRAAELLGISQRALSYYLSKLPGD